MLLFVFPLCFPNGVYHSANHDPTKPHRHTVSSCDDAQSDPMLFKLMEQIFKCRCARCLFPRTRQTIPLQIGDIQRQKHARCLRKIRHQRIRSRLNNLLRRFSAFLRPRCSAGGEFNQPSADIHVTTEQTHLPPSRPASAYISAHHSPSGRSAHPASSDALPLS